MNLNSTSTVPTLIVTLLALLGALWLSHSAKVTIYSGDNVLYLPTAQSILDNGTVNLDEAFASYGKDAVTQNAYWTTIEVNGHQFNYFPLGSSLFSIPFVFIANQFGLDAFLVDDAIKIQKFVCGFILFLTFLVFRNTARLFFSTGSAAGLAAITIVCSSVVSVGSSALWSHNLTVLFIGLALFEMLRLEFRVERKWSPWIMGFYLFAAYICRPAAATFVIPILAFCLVKHGRRFHQVFLPLLACMGLFMFWSQQTYDILLPPYYLPNRLGETGDIVQAFQGHLWSPSRGVLVYSPIFLVSVLGILFKANRRWLFFWFLAGAYLLHLILISRFIHWWGGWSYGPRLQTDMVPLLFVLGLMALDAYRKYKPGPWLRKVVMVPLLIFSGWSFFVQVPQGVFNPSVLYWNGNIDRYPEYYLFNWTFPQFLAGYYPDGIALENANFQEMVKGIIKDLEPGDELFLPLDQPNSQRLAKLHNLRNTFNGVTVQVQRKNLKIDQRATYVTLEGRAALEAEGQWNFELLGDTLRLGDLFDDPDYPLTFIAGNHVNMGSLSYATRLRLEDLESDFLDQIPNLGWIALVEDGRLQKEVLVEEDHVEIFYIAGHKIEVWCKGVPELPGFGIQIDQHEAAAARLGFNVVQYNFETNLYRNFHFEPKYGDIESASVFRVLPK